MAAKISPSQKKTSDRSPETPATSTGASPLVSRSAPTPNPMMTIPAASPFRWGNHLTTVATGVT